MMKNISRFVAYAASALAVLSATGAGSAAFAQSATPAGTPAPTASAASIPLSDGEITRWDPRTLRVTLRHGEIKNLEMPPMTMVFRVQDASIMGNLKPGDKVRFHAEQVNGAYHVKQIEKAP
jgi:Cu/Ag efflux protein CusF